MDKTIETYTYESAVVGGLELKVTSLGVKSIRFTQTGGTGNPRVRDHPILKTLISELDAYFCGIPTVFSTPLDPASGTAFQRTVWEALTRIPYGQTRSYGDIAAEIGKPGAARAVGHANGANEIPILVPCHRVIGSNGALGGYGPGVEFKRALLHLERADLGPTAERKKG